MTMFGFVTKLKKKEEQRATTLQQQRQSYRELLRQAAEKGKLTPAEDDRLTALVEGLNLTADRAQADAETVAELVAMERDSAARAERRAAVAKARERATAKRAAIRRMEEEFTARMESELKSFGVLEDEFAAAVKAHAAAAEAGNRANELRLDNPGLFDAPADTAPATLVLPEALHTYLFGDRTIPATDAGREEVYNTLGRAATAAKAAAVEARKLLVNQAQAGTPAYNVSGVRFLDAAVGELKALKAPAFAAWEASRALPQPVRLTGAA